MDPATVPGTTKFLYESFGGASATMNLLGKNFRGFRKATASEIPLDQELLEDLFALKPC